jgi:hypothetical protein
MIWLKQMGAISQRMPTLARQLQNLSGNTIGAPDDKSRVFGLG